MSMSPSRPRGRRSRAKIALALALALVVVAWPDRLMTPVARGADPSSDIPGVALPGTIATGRLGGAIYDVVYNFEVPAGHVIVVSLTGTAGTDFDLYLFDASATTVLSTVGLLTKSNGPTSTESISWPSRLGGTYYVDLNGATDVEGDFRLTVQAVPDQSPPSVSILLAGGRSSTNQLAVPVTLTATEDLSGIALMAFSLDGLTFGEWLPFQASTTVAVPAGDGPRTVWAKVRNGVGLESPPSSDSTEIDTISPAVLAIQPGPGVVVPNLRPTFRITFNEAIEPATWADLGLIVQSGSGGLVAGASSYDAATRTGSFTPLAAMTPGASYAVTVGNVTDVAGNLVTALGSWSITPIAPTAMSVRATPMVLLRGASATLEAILSGAPVPVSVDVLSAESGGTMEPLTSIPTQDGKASLAVTPPRNTTYRFRYAGSFGVAAAEADVRILVRRSIVLSGRNSTSVASARVGTPVSLAAVVGPAAAALSVSFKLYRFDATRRSWVYAGSRGRNTDASGRATFVWTPASPGSWYVRAAVASTADYANNVSPVYRWSVTR